jgi:hypothetical protein
VISRNSGCLPAVLRRVLTVGASAVPGMVPGASKRNVLVALAYLLVGLLVVGLVSDSGAALLSLPGAQAPV